MEESAPDANMAEEKIEFAVLYFLKLSKIQDSTLKRGVRFFPKYQDVITSPPFEMATLCTNAYTNIVMAFKNNNK